MDREALERGIARRLLDHLADRTTDLADDVLEVSTDIYLGAHHDREVEVLFRAKGLVELPVAEGYGLIVGRLRPGPAIDIDDYLGPGLLDEVRD
jgi:hypothetical protein